jgi:NADPH:quinone reductase-like Zn-dependent oxidoreductase
MADMTAITFQRGGPEQLHASSIPRPEPGPTEVLIRAKAVGVNPVDWKTRNGSGVYGFFDHDRPMVLGWDVAGEVAETGPGVTRFQVGDRVFGMPRFPHPAETYAEYVTAPSIQVARTPDGVTDQVAAAASLAGLTAWQAVVDTLNISESDRVLIHAAAGGVGHLAVQIAKAQGAEVWGTASAEKHDLLRNLGLDHPIDYHSQDFAAEAHEMDAVLDLVGLDNYPVRSLQTLRRGGRLLVIPSGAQLPDPKEVEAAGISAGTMLVEPDQIGLDAIAGLLASGDLRVVIEATRPLSEMAELHRAGETGRTTGKLVATVDH